MSKRNAKVVRLYIVGLICIIGYFFLENSDIIPNLVEQMSKFRYDGLPTFFLTGLFKYGLLIVGIGIIVIMTFLLTKERINK